MAESDKQIDANQNINLRRDIEEENSNLIG